MSRNLRIAIISHMYPSVIRPTSGRFIHEHVKALQAAGAQVRVISPVPWTPPGMARLNKKWADYSAVAGLVENYDGINVARPAYATPPHPLNFVGAWSMAARLRWSWKKLMAGFDCDLIHAHTITPDGFAACKLAKSLRLPVICSARGSEVHTTPKESAMVHRMTRWALRQTDGMIAVSHALAEEAANIAEAEATLKPKVIYNGVGENFKTAGDRLASRRKLNLSAAAQIILFVGRCERDKGLGELLQASGDFSRLNPKAELVIVGDGGARSELELAARCEPFDTRVHFVGQVGRDGIGEYLQAADIFVLPSYGEGMPNALLEAMAAGLPCVATHVGGIPEAIQDGVNGILIPPKSAGAIAGALKKIFSAPDLSRDLGAAARRTIADKFSWPANAHAHLEFYEQVIAKFHRR
jgi:glycosyltransferase involved in cell wall biosynthesis